MKVAWYILGIVIFVAIYLFPKRKNKEEFIKGILFVILCLLAIFICPRTVVGMIFFMIFTNLILFSNAKGIMKNTLIGAISYQLLGFYSLGIYYDIIKRGTLENGDITGIEMLFTIGITIIITIIYLIIKLAQKDYKHTEEIVEENQKNEIKKILENNNYDKTKIDEDTINAIVKRSTKREIFRYVSITLIIETIIWFFFEFLTSYF